MNNSPTILQAKTGAEPCSDALGENASVDTGNPDVRIPVKIPAKGRVEKPEEKNTAGAGNPDIQVPERFKRKEGLRVWDKEGEEDAEERDAEKAERVDNGGNEEEDNPDLGERWPFDSRGDTTRGLDSPTKPDLRHVPGGTCLQQKSENSSNVDSTSTLSAPPRTYDSMSTSPKVPGIYSLTKLQEAALGFENPEVETPS
ncbi:hypothetical protein NDU88_001623 [Pleurodeles waltl]|uniref:Prolactin receptor n=1 Tax=Pleurodeles waltl TaxID=8319 RepID=A0AAV7KPX9_PLEWA|nr:hypothetical protein NDU88_001623 [Pleurodeles waltl]